MSLYFVLGFMTKFVAALFLPAILVLAAASHEQDRVRVYRDWPMFALAALLALALIAPWFVYQYAPRGRRPSSEGHLRRARDEALHRVPGSGAPASVDTTTSRKSGTSSTRAGVRTICVVGALLLLWRAVRETLDRRHWWCCSWFCLPLGVMSTDHVQALSLLLSIPAAGRARRRHRRGVDCRACCIARSRGRPTRSPDAAPHARTLPDLSGLAGRSHDHRPSVRSLLAAVTFGFDRLSVSGGPVVAEELQSCPGPPLPAWHCSCWRRARRDASAALSCQRSCCSVAAGARVPRECDAHVTTQRRSLPRCPRLPRADRGERGGARQAGAGRLGRGGRAVAHAFLSTCAGLGPWQQRGLRRRTRPW